MDIYYTQAVTLFKVNFNCAMNFHKAWLSVAVILLVAMTTCVLIRELISDLLSMLTLLHKR